MKIKDIQETMVTGDSETSLEKIFYQLLSNNPDVIHVGDIEEVAVYKKESSDICLYFFYKNDIAVGFASTIESSHVEVENVFFIKTEQRRGLFAMFILFLKRIQGFSKIVLGKYHSPATVEAVKRIAFRFKAHWEKGNEKIPYDASTIDDYYSVEQPTGWQLVLENSDSNTYPKYYDINNFTMAMLYECFLDDPKI